jgi:hypothetical protein
MPLENESKTKGLLIGVEGILRSLVRLLVNRVSLASLMRLTREIYVQEAEKVIAENATDGAVTLSQLALSTGLDTRTLRKVRAQIEGDEDLSERFLTRLTPESVIVEAWAERAADPVHGKAWRTLDYGTENSDFEDLVRNTISTRGVTSQSIIRRLVATGSIRQDTDAHTVTLLVERFSPYRSSSHHDFLISALSAVSNLLSTVQHNERCEPDDRFLQRQLWSTRLGSDELIELRTLLRRHLEDCEENCRSELAVREKPSYDASLSTAGIGIYYFEDRD